MIKEIVLDQKGKKEIAENNGNGGHKCWRNQWRNCWRNCWRNYCGHK